MGDGRDWTFVLTDLCTECGVDVQDLDERELGGLIRSAGRTWQLMLTDHTHDAATTARPAPDIWSPVEYGEHVRDVLVLYRQRVELMLTQADPMFADWDPDTSSADYGQTDPAVVGGQIATAADDLAARYDPLDESALARPGRRSDGASFDVGSIGRYLLHDVLHHVWDADHAW